MKSKGIKVIIIVVLLTVSVVVYADVNYNRIGPGGRLYYYLFPFLTPADSAASNIPIGKFIGSKAEVEKVEEANLNYQAALILYERDNNPYGIEKFTVDLPESKSVDPNSLSPAEKSKLINLGLWDGKGKISFVATLKVGSKIKEKEEAVINELINLKEKYPKLFDDAAQKVEKFKQNSSPEKFLKEISNENERKIAADILFIKKISGITVRSEADLKNLRKNVEVLKQITRSGSFLEIKEKLRNDIKDSVIGIRISGNKAILVYGIPDALYTQIRKFVKIGDTYKLYTITNLKHTKLLNEELEKYWEEKINPGH